MSAAPVPTSYHRWLIAVLIVVLSLMVAGGLTARRLYRVPESSPTTVAELPSTATLPVSEQPGPDTVELTRDAAAHPQHEAVRTLLQQYFNSINSRNYDEWKNTVTRAREQEKSRASFQQEYQTTKDGSILVYRIESQSNKSLRVFVAFTSTQDKSAAPAVLPETCVRWDLVLPLSVENGHYQVDVVAGSAPTVVSPC